MKVETLITKDEAINIITELGFQLLKNSDEGAILLNTTTENEVEFFCDDAVFLIDVIKWLGTQIKIQTEIMFNDIKIPQHESNEQL
jgi:hypothetical protein